MPRRDIRVIVLFEDEAQRVFLREIVQQTGLSAVRYVRGIDCTGVLTELPLQVKLLRSRNFQKNLGLLVAIDADKGGLSGRRAELLRLIRECGREREANERIALLVPARAIESWYVHLCAPAARPIDEEIDYKQSTHWRAVRDQLGTAAHRSVETWLKLAERVDPPSLVAAREELRRVV